MDEITQLIQYFNSTGGIPLQVTQTTSTNWIQFSTTIVLTLIGSAFLVIYLFSTFKETISPAIMRIRLRLLKKKIKQNILLIKHTESSMFSQSMIDKNTMKEIAKALEKFKGKPFSIILHTPGGEIFSTLFITRLLKEYPGKINAIIPRYAMSGGTLIALSCDNIYMSNTSCLGPVDPQLGSLFKYGSAKSWNHILKFKGKKADDSSISLALTGKQYTKTISEQVDNLLIDKIDDKKQRKEMVKLLTQGEVEHAFALTSNDLSKHGLNIKPINKKIIKNINKIVDSSSFEGVTYV